MSMDHIPVLDVEGPWFEKLYEGVKVDEGRKRSVLRKILGLSPPIDPRVLSLWSIIGKTVLIRFNPSELYPSSTCGATEFAALIVDASEYSTLYDYLVDKGWRKVLPHPKIISFFDAVNEYHRFFTDEEIASAGGMVSVTIKRIV